MAKKMELNTTKNVQPGTTGWYGENVNIGHLDFHGIIGYDEHQHNGAHENPSQQGSQKMW